MLTLSTSMNCTVRGQPSNSTPEMLTSRAPFQKVRKPMSSVSFTDSPGWDMLPPHLTKGRSVLFGWLERATIAALTATPEEMTCTPGSRYNRTVQLPRGSRPRSVSSRDPAGVGCTDICDSAGRQADVPCESFIRNWRQTNKYTRTRQGLSCAIAVSLVSHNVV